MARFIRVKQEFICCWRCTRDYACKGPDMYTEAESLANKLTPTALLGCCLEVAGTPVNCNQHPLKSCLESKVLHKFQVAVNRDRQREFLLISIN